MKKLFRKIMTALEFMGNVRAASALARMGHHDAARRLIMK